MRGRRKGETEGRRERESVGPMCACVRACVRRCVWVYYVIMCEKNEAGNMRCVWQGSKGTPVDPVVNQPLNATAIKQQLIVKDGRQNKQCSLCRHII